MSAEWDDLARLAEAIPPKFRDWTYQPWGEQNQNGDHASSILFDGIGETIIYELPDEEGEFIAAANPATILRLIEDLRATRVCYTDECGEPCRSHVALLWAERDTARKKVGLIGQRLGKVRAERDALAARLAAVEALHRVDPNSGHNPDCPCGRPAYDGQRCSHCRLPWPCPTSAALAAPTDTTKEQ